jgi:hypothetical protein
LDDVQVSLGYAGKTTAHTVRTVGSFTDLFFLGTCVNNTQSSACIAHSDYDDSETISSQFLRKLEYNSINSTRTATNTTRPSNSSTATPSPTSTDDATLSNLLSIISELQEDVFPLAPPLSFLIAFSLSTIFFGFLLPSPTGRVAYKAVFAGTTLLNSWGLTVGFMVALATRQAGKSLVVPGLGNKGDLDNISVTVGDDLQVLQWTTVALATVLQFFIAWLFVQRRAVGEEVRVIMIPAMIINRLPFTKKRR